MLYHWLIHWWNLLQLQRVPREWGQLKCQVIAKGTEHSYTTLFSSHLLRHLHTIHTTNINTSRMEKSHWPDSSLPFPLSQICLWVHKKDSLCYHNMELEAFSLSSPSTGSQSIHVHVWNLSEAFCSGQWIEFGCKAVIKWERQRYLSWAL